MHADIIQENSYHMPMKIYTKKIYKHCIGNTGTNELS